VKPGGRMRGYIAANGPYCPVNYSYINPANRNPITENTGEISLPDVEKNLKIKIFPNPTSGQVTVQLPENEETRLLKVEITDINGIREFSEELPALRNHTLSVESLLPGMYILHVTTGRWKETVKLVRW
jgi:hypothetical protein